MRHSKILLLPFLAASAALFAQTSTTAQNATVRGMLESVTSNSKQPNPAPGILVTIENQSYTSLAVKSGNDGLYYIPNVSPGSYVLKVWVDPHKPLTFPITIKPELTDIPPVIVTSESTAKAHSPAHKTKPKAAPQNK